MGRMEIKELLDYPDLREILEIKEHPDQMDN